MVIANPLDCCSWYVTPELLAYLQRLDSIAQSRQETMAEMALAWILHQEGVTSVLVGASSVEQLQADIRCLHAAPFADTDI